TVSVSDNGSGGSNTYTKDADQANGSVTTPSSCGGTCGVRTLVFSAPVSHALSSGTITVSFPSGTLPMVKAATFFSFDGIVQPPSTAKDQTHAQPGSTQNVSNNATTATNLPNSGNTPSNTGSADELLIGALGYEDSQATITPGAGYTGLTQSAAGSKNKSNSLLMQPEFQVARATGTFAAGSGGLASNASASAQWAAAIV